MLTYRESENRMGQLIYCGIGSRETPRHILTDMTGIAKDLAEHGWVLRSGFAGGADMAFYNGAKANGGKMENYIPWGGFNQHPKSVSFIRPAMTQELLELAKEHHPNWDACSMAAKKLHARNGCQILGLDLKTPVKMVICWTPNAKSGGGTGQAIRIARANNIPVFDLADDKAFDRLVAFVQE